jgi:hypothetical protein
VPSRSDTYASRRLSGAHASSASSLALDVIRIASPPSLADAEKISPWTVNAIFLPSGESESSWI